jgi:hypothetical protein
MHDLGSNIFNLPVAKSDFFVPAPGWKTGTITA